MLPISSITQAMSAYGIQPQGDTAAPGLVAPKLPDMPDMPNIGATSGVKEAVSLPTGQTSSGDSFSSMLGKFVNDVNTQQLKAGAAMSSLEAGGNVSLHQAVIAMEEANVSFQLMVEVRNKLLEAYQELMRMQI